MKPETKNPAALAGANRVQNDHLADNDADHNPNGHVFQFPDRYWLGRQERQDRLCDACDCFQPRGDADYGECRADLPKRNQSNWMSRWPTGARWEWCGKFIKGAQS
jgi:hypothetical protein